MGPIESLLTLKGSNASKRSQPTPSSPASSHANTLVLCNGLSTSDTDDSIKRYTVPVDPRLSQQRDQFATQDTTLGHMSQPFGHHIPNSSSLKTECGFPTASLALDNDFYDDDIALHSARTAPSSIWSGSSPCLAERLLPSIDLYARPPDLMDYQTMEPIPACQHRCLLDQQISSTMEEDVEEVIREPDTCMIPMSSPTQSDSSSSSRGSLPCDIFANPTFHPYSQEMLLKRFDTHTCGILSIKNGRDENPWRMMLWPLAMTEPALHDAISAMTAFHASKDDRSLRRIGVQHMTQSVQQLSLGLNTMRIEAALSTTLVLAFCESWDLLITTGIKHLRGARDQILRLMENCSPDAMSQQSLECIGFLVRTWVYMDVIARLTSLEGDDSEAFDILGTPICQMSMQDHGIDPLMGCASTMFPTIGRVGNLIRKVRQTRRQTRKNSYKVIEEATILKAQLEKWKSPRLFEEPQDKSTDVEQALWTAEAYRSATLLYLYQAVPEISLDSVVDKIAGLATKVLTNLANVPVTSGAVIIQIFPLLAAGCEATDPEHRVFIEERWKAMVRRMKIGNIDKCLDIVRDVWERRDSHEAQRLRNKAFVPDSNIQASDIPTTIIKRSISIGDNPYDRDSQISIDGTRTGLHTPSDPSRFGHMRGESSIKEEELDFELTVRGSRHWAGVMKDKDWEGESIGL